MPSLTPSLDQAAPPAHSSSGSSVATAAPAHAPRFGSLVSSEPPPQEASNGAHRDGRIRNPVPSKLKGKTDGSRGNFGVMQIEVAGRADATDRDAQAKRTSESTQLAAKRAFENGYVSLRRSRFVHLPDEPAAKPYVPPSAPVSAPAAPQRHFPLGPEETKSEQARLLTLLRSLHPVLVVDQICKALAFFGGIPGALPPANGKFPESAEANGSGSLFVGWIAEIFPKLGGNSGQQSLDSVRPLDNPQPVKRKRGRPKGSKATKTRKDKGVKKRSNKARPDTDQQQASSIPDDSWIDVDDGGVASTDHADPDVMPLPHAASPKPQRGSSTTAMMPGNPTEPSNAAAKTALPAAPAAGGTAADGPPSARRRGRPKGSKNRPKDWAVNSVQPHVETETQPTQGAPAPSQNAQRTPMDHTVLPAAGLLDAQSSTAVNSAPEAPPKRKAGRSKGAGPKQQAQMQQSEISPGSEQPHETGITGSSNSDPAAHGQLPASYPSQITHDSHAQSLTLPTPPTASPSQAKPSKSAGQKRKRKGDAAADASLAPPGDHRDGSAPMQDVSGRALPTPPSNPGAPPLATAPEPAPKRQRKAKEPRSLSRSGNQVAPQAITGPPAIAATGASSSKSVPDPSPRLGSAPAPVSARKSEPTLLAAPVESAATSVPSSQQGQFEGQSSPTTDTYGAQLQAQFDQQTEVEPHTIAPANPRSPTQLVNTRLQQQPHRQPPAAPQQQRFAQPPNHQQLLQRQHQNQQHASVAHSRSPNAQSQSVNSSVVAHQQQQQQQQPHQPQPQQQQTRTLQNHYNQYRVQSSHYRQHQQQAYISSPPEQSQHQRFSGGQPQSTQMPQKASSQQRYQQQLATTSAETASFTTHQSPHFSPSTTANFSPVDAGYRSPAASLTNASYGQRNQSTAPSPAAPFRAASTHGLPPHSSHFGTGNASLQQRSMSSGQPSSQGMPGLASVQAFAGSTASDWGLFDSSPLDAAGQQGAMGMSNANYGIGAASVRASSNGDPGFSAASLTTFDTSGLGGADRFYGVGRR
ncbi:uncharacterized protein THITE_133081 [Thermothielavioides terrestris NRRL 8126]|uniref:Uncharacterized protein n=1 Tax=Thermothielavioides terrestris (strain ATCC 38088 / NRRL 8126) TaxID=578455 RepID=G2R221_THETT|nr:uncharacterized protein THITE_133081 [Thermothielavioides terrestris NRRL 8126]AEO65802.1 hypothetical protein THITE_133081 [Thermothielavioides terrestris NRRL 8126]